MKKKQKGRTPIIIGTCAIVALMAVSAILVIHMLLSDDGNKRRKQVQMITLVKPPPPPKIKEKPPEPEVEKKEEIIEPEPEETPPENLDEADSDVPEGDDLGLDAEGTAGGDGFGLRGKKGGRGLLVGGSGSLLRKFSWYTSIIQQELHGEIKVILEKNGGIPQGKHKTQIKISIDEIGRISQFKIVKPTGIQSVDSAIEQALMAYQVSEPPPPEMPRTIELAISSSG